MLPTRSSDDTPAPELCSDPLVMGYVTSKWTQPLHQCMSLKPLVPLSVQKTMTNSLLWFDYIERFFFLPHFSKNCSWFSLWFLPSFCIFEKILQRQSLKLCETVETSWGTLRGPQNTWGKVVLMRGWGHLAGCRTVTTDLAVTGKPLCLDL